ncbi:MAG: DUF2971 domain-containing protein [Bacteroidales bacterium]|nr:DUF2971 domain-containing protein [Bacteroidales bacterium]
MTKLIEDENILFKYVPFNTNTLKNLINNELWFGKPKNQNDPYEGEFVIDGFEKDLSKERKIELIKEIHKNAPSFIPEEKYRNDPNDRIFLWDYSFWIKELIKDLFGICCFSITYEEILLWTHYSDSHKGLCLVFDQELLDKSLKNQNSDIVKSNITYTENIPHVKVNFREDGSPFVNGYSQLKFKVHNFEYEKEFRYIILFDKDESSQRAVKFDKQALKGVIFGENMSIENRRTIINLFSSVSGYNHMVFFVSTKNIETGSISAMEVSEQHPDYYELFRDQGAEEPFPFFTTRIEK